MTPARLRPRRPNMRRAVILFPSGLTLGPDGDLYIADTFSGRIRRVDLATGNISTVAGDGGEYRFSGLPNEFLLGGSPGLGKNIVMIVRTNDSGV